MHEHTYHHMRAQRFRMPESCRWQQGDEVHQRCEDSFAPAGSLGVGQWRWGRVDAPGGLQRRRSASSTARRAAGTPSCPPQHAARRVSTTRFRTPAPAGTSPAASGQQTPCPQTSCRRACAEHWQNTSENIRWFPHARRRCLREPMATLTCDERGYMHGTTCMPTHMVRPNSAVNRHLRRVTYQGPLDATGL